MRKKVTVIGLGVTGFYSASFFAKRGLDVSVMDIKKEEELRKDYVEGLKRIGVEIIAGRYDERCILESDIVILSPSVPVDLPVLEKAREKGVCVIGELEFASRMIEKPIVAITGTNGKSTVTTLIGNILRRAGKKVFVGGNIGRPLISYFEQDEEAEIFVLEVSSYQLDSVEKFSPFISVILNITPDHLDHYGRFERYVESKLKIFRNQKPESYLILNDDDKILSQISPSNVKVLRYGIQKRWNRDAYIEDGKIKCLGIEFSFEDIKLIGMHNIVNLMPVILCCLLLDVEKEIIEKEIREFKGLPHRLEFVLEKEGIAFFDDSKATNVDSAVSAIKSIERPIILIAGGKDKGGGYRQLKEAAKEKVKHAVLLGEASTLIAKEFEGEISYEMAKDMYDAVEKAYSKAKKGDAILLSPACSSFDMFKDYSHRGEVFKDAIRRIVSGK